MSRKFGVVTYKPISSPLFISDKSPSNEIRKSIDSKKYRGTTYYI